MKTINAKQAALMLAMSLLSANSMAGEACASFGPQAPRDIDSTAGDNKRIFSMAPGAKDMNLCNIHFHTNAEHKARDFSIHAVAAKHGDGHGAGHSDGHDKGDAGYQCNMSKSLSIAELAAPKVNHCKGIKPGDTVEVHWVHSSCDVKPGKGLGSCLSPECSNPNLRVETQVFTVVNDSSALNFMDFAYNGNMNNGYHQAKALPGNTGTAVEYTGSTTGPKYTAQKCSPLEVSWGVRPQCAKLDINSLSNWCKGNVFKEDHAHGVRKLVVNPALLSKIK